jgi:glycosyltransferase involved in cell wall biosynthesis
MNSRSDLVSVVTATYERARTLGRAIDSVLAQTYPHLELIVVDDGSTDATGELVARYRDPRLRYVRHPQNRGVTAAKNTGFDHARGEWITTLDSDDEMVPHALFTLLQALEDVDPELDAVSCNCCDARTGRFTGRGLDRSQYIDVPQVLRVCRGEHWGMFRRRLLGDRRFSERIQGYEGILWYKIHESARWYYLHEGLRIYHTEGSDRLGGSLARPTRHARRMYQLYAAIFDEERDYLDRLSRWSTPEYIRMNRKAAGSFVLAGDRARFAQAAENLAHGGARTTASLLSAAMAVRSTFPRLRT